MSKFNRSLETTMENLLLILGVSILAVLGAIHLLYTFFTDKFSPYDPKLKDGMQGTTPKLTKETTMWRAWIGFNASHSLGAMLLGAFYLPLLNNHFQVITHSAWLSILPSIVSFAYLLLAKKYWFNVPFFGVLISLLCFLGFIILVTF